MLFHVRMEGKHGIRYVHVSLFEITYHDLLKGRKKKKTINEDTKFDTLSSIIFFIYETTQGIFSTI